MRQLYLLDLPDNCTEQELKEWMESRGVHISNLRIIRDLLTGVSPCFACLEIERVSEMTEPKLTLLRAEALRDKRLQS